MDTLRITSFNCHGVKGRRTTVEEVCGRSDIVAIQEHWLTPEDLPFLSNIHPDFRGHGISAMDPSAGLLIGRPYGGVALMWRRCLDDAVTIIKTDNNRVAAIKVNSIDSQMLIICVYCPYFSIENTEEFINTLGYVHSLLLECDIANTFILGDFNSKPGSPFWHELSNHSRLWDLTIYDYMKLPEDSFTYICPNSSSQSWLDHILTTSGAHFSITNVQIHYDIIGSDHFPLSCSVNFSQLPGEVLVGSSGREGGTTRWARLNEPQVAAEYSREIERLLSSVTPTTHIQYCKKRSCKDHIHLTEIVKLYSEIIDLMHSNGWQGFLTPIGHSDGILIHHLY